MLTGGFLTGKTNADDDGGQTRTRGDARGFPECEERSDGRGSARGSSWRSQRGSPFPLAPAASGGQRRGWRRSLLTR